MPYSPHYRPYPRWFTLRGGLEDPVRPAAFPKRVLRFRNDRAAAALGLEALDAEEWERAFARFEPLLCNLREPLALRYHGHQFGVYNPALGDGRGFLFAQLRERGTGRLVDLGTKGTGQTPWSRGGDGRLTLKGGVREVLATEMLESMGVPTSRTLSLFETGEALVRSDEPSPTRSSVLVRAQESHVRFGTFQRLAHHGDAERARRLVRYAAEHYFPALDRGAADAELARALLGQVVARTARLAAWWMAAGFVHGVLNTDNFVVTGESFDYGPWRFLPTCDRGFVAAYFDPGGRYAYGRQPEVARWNLERLADALALVADREALEEPLATYDDAFGRELAAAVAARLGLEGPPDARAGLAEAMFAFLEESGAPFEQVFYDGYGGFERARLARSPAEGAYAGAAFEALARAAARLSPTAAARAAPGSPALAGASPETMLVDEVEAVWAAIDARDDWGPFERKIAAVRARARR